MFSLTTKLKPRDFIAVSHIATRNGMTESAWVRELIERQIDVYTEEVGEEEIDRLRVNGRRSVPKKRKSPWYRFWR